MNKHNTTSCQTGVVSITTHQAARLLSSFSHFLTVAIHLLLYHRALYPARSFLAARAYNLPVHQSRHPGVRAWVADAVAAVATQIRAGAARAVVLCVHAPPPELAVLERWVFDLQSFPASWGDDAAAPTTSGGDAVDAGGVTMVDEMADVDEANAGQQQQQPVESGGEETVNWTNVHEALRGALRRIAYAGEKSPPLPENCTFTLAVELRDDSPAPIGHPQPWIPAESPKGSGGGGASSSALRDMTTAPIRSVRAGPLFFECWLEKKGPDAG